MTKLYRGMLALAGCVALALPAGAVASGDGEGHTPRPGDGPADGPRGGHGEHGEHGDSGRRRVPFVAYVIRGDVKSVVTGDEANSVVVTVKRSNRPGRALRGKDITVDIAAETRVVTADHNGDGQRDLADLAQGDDLKVHARMPKRLGPVGEDFRTLAKRIVATRPASEPVETPQP